MAYKFTNDISDVTASFPSSAYSPFDFKNVETTFYDVSNETFNVPASSPYKMHLDYIPVSQEDVTITVGGVSRTIIPYGESPSSTEVAMQFETGSIIEFNSNDSGSQCIISYKGLSSGITSHHLNTIGKELEAVQDALVGGSTPFVQSDGSVTDQSIARWDGTDGGTIDTCGFTINDSDELVVSDGRIVITSAAGKAITGKTQSFQPALSAQSEETCYIEMIADTDGSNSGPSEWNLVVPRSQGNFQIVNAGGYEILDLSNNSLTDTYIQVNDTGNVILGPSSGSNVTINSGVLTAATSIGAGDSISITSAGVSLATVAGAMSFDSGKTGPVGANPVICFDDSQTTGMYSSATGEINLACSGTDILDITASEITCNTDINVGSNDLVLDFNVDANTAGGGQIVWTGEDSGGDIRIYTFDDITSDSFDGLRVEVESNTFWEIRAGISYLAINGYRLSLSSSKVNPYNDNEIQLGELTKRFSSANIAGVTRSDAGFSCNTDPASASYLIDTYRSSGDIYFRARTNSADDIIFIMTNDTRDYWIRNNASGNLLIRDNTAGFNHIECLGGLVQDAVTINADATTDFSNDIDIAGDVNADKVIISNGTTAATPTLELDQNDADQAFINFAGTTPATGDPSDLNISTANGSGSLDGPKNRDTVGAGWNFEGMLRIEVNGTEKWIPYYDNDFVDP